MHLYNFIDGKPTDSMKILQKKIDKKQKLIKTKEEIETLQEVRNTLLDYHRRRRYDDYEMNHFQLSFPPIFLSPSLLEKKNKSGQTFVHTYQYTNINGKEEEKEEKYMIDEKGKKKKLALKNK